MLEVGQILNDRYQLERRLGQNAGRQTWLAFDSKTATPEKPETQTPVIIKLLAFGGDVQWQDLQLFEREAQILKQLNHPRIPQYKDYFSLDERMLWFALVQEYIPGIPLNKLLQQQQRFSEDDLRQIAKQVLKILIYLHKLTPPILHRDIKPSNLIMGENKEIFLVDFGAVQDRAITNNATFTVVGTYGYAPLEQFGGKAVPASDLYALGATLIHLLTGTPPADLPTRNLRLQFRRLIAFDTPFLYWLEKMTEPALERRFSSAEKALLALDYGALKLKPKYSSVATRTEREKPIYSKVEIYRYPQGLEITIPQRGIKGLLGIAIASFLISSVGFLLWLLLTLPAWLFSLSSASHFWVSIFWLILLLKSTAYLFTETQIIINTRFVKIQKSLFEINYFLTTIITSNVRDISVNYQQAFGGVDGFRAKEIIITSEGLFDTRKFERRLVAQGLTETELIWLAQVIRQWLAENI